LRIGPACHTGTSEFFTRLPLPVGYGAITGRSRGPTGSTPRSGSGDPTARGGPVRFVGTQQGGNMNRGIIGTIIGVLVIIVLVLVIRQMM
jgi:hypothetical protein